MSEVVFHIDGSTARFRLAAYARSLARPSSLIPLLLLAGSPFAVLEAVGVVAPEDGWRTWSLLLGLGAVTALVALGALIAVARRQPPSSLTFDEHGIRETTARGTIEHGWDWIADVVEDDQHVTLLCHAPMRSFRLASSADQRVVVLPRHDARAERLLEMWRARAGA
jgi:hypothetical protein